MPLVEVGPGYVSPSSGGYSAPGATAPAPAAPVAPSAPVFTMPGDTFNGAPAVPTGPVPAPASPFAPAPATGGTVQAKSFFSNLWDQLIGPLFKSIANFFSGLFGRAAGGTIPAAASIPSR